MTLVVYSPTLRGGFIWDDDDYVTENANLRSGEGLKRIWLEPSSSPQYYPLVFTVFWLEYQMWGVNPTGYHVVNAVLHALSALLLWTVLRRLDLRGAWLAALVFGLHPVHVESVAWVTELKNVLSGCFYFASCLCLIRFFGLEKETDNGFGARLPYALGLSLFVFALLSKTVTASLPAAFLLILWWKRGRVEWREIFFLLPFFLLGLGSGLYTAWLEQHQVGAVGAEWNLSLVQRCLIAGRALWFYAGKLVWPHVLVFNYPRWGVEANAWWQYCHPAAASLVIIGLWAFRKGVGRGPLAATLFFCGTLFPSLGFLNVYPFRYSFVADHFQYLASVGLIVLAVEASIQVIYMLPSSLQPVRIPAASVVILLLALKTLSQSHGYYDVETLWTETLKRNPASWIAHNNLGMTLTDQGRMDDAIDHFKAAIRLKPDLVRAHSNLGMALAKRGDLRGAAESFSKVVELEPDSFKVRFNLAVAVDGQGRLEEAIEHYLEALRMKPRDGGLHTRIAVVLARQGRLDEAISHLSQAVRLNSSPVEALTYLGAVFMQKEQYDEAIGYLRRALDIDPGYGGAYLNLGRALISREDAGTAVSVLFKAVQLMPGSAEAHYGLATALEKEGRLEEASGHYAKADAILRNR